MKKNNKRGFILCVITLIIFGTTAVSWSQPPVPSHWRGEITGKVHNKTFRLPVDLEFKQPIQHENNPFHLFIGAGKPQDVGNLFLSSAMSFSTRKGDATLQYLTISLQGNRLQATLSDTHKAEAAKANGFSGPNVSAAQASSLMRDIMKDVYGDCEMFGFSRGATLTIQFNGNQLSGVIRGNGVSYTETSSPVQYQAQFQARRIK